MSNPGFSSYRTRYLSGGKELDTETNLYYYGARYFEPNIVVWYGVDPLAEKYPFNGGYVYCSANPVRYVDPDGRNVGLMIAPAGAQGFRHMGAIVQDGKGNCYYVTAGAAEEIQNRRKRK